MVSAFITHSDTFFTIISNKEGATERRINAATTARISSSHGEISYHEEFAITRWGTTVATLDQRHCTAVSRLSFERWKTTNERAYRDVVNHEVHLIMKDRCNRSSPAFDVTHKIRRSCTLCFFCGTTNTAPQKHHLLCQRPASSSQSNSPRHTHTCIMVEKPAWSDEMLAK